VEEAKTWEEFFSRFKGPKEYEIEHRYDIDFDQHYLIVGMRVEDSYNPGQIIPISIRNALPMFSNYGEKYAQAYLRRVIQDLACHEIDEHIRYDNELIFNPHINEFA
jgi:hypothetical protein